MASRVAQAYQEHREFIWLLFLATTFKLSAALLLTQGGYLYDGHQIYDYQFYRRVGEMSLAGQYPGLDYWLEYPPVFAWAIVGIYRLSLLLPAMRDPIFWFHNFLGSFLALVDAGNLILIYGIERRLSGPAAALRACWIYALLFWPLYVMLGWLDPLPLLFLLATVYGLVANRPLLAGFAAGAGLMTKMIPAVVAPAALRAFAGRKQIGLCALAGIATSAAIAFPFLLTRPDLFYASFVSVFSRSSWETVWALLEGYFDVGVVAPLGSHLDPATATWQNHPSILPWPLITAVFIACYLVALALLRRDSARATVAFAGLSITLLFLFSKGYSAQFIEYVLPFVILLMPDGRGIALTFLLSISNLLQFPVFAMVFPKEHWVTWVATSSRTMLWLALATIYFTQATGLVPRWLARARDRATAPALIAAGLLVVILAWPLANSYVRNRGEHSDLQQYLRPLAAPDQGVVLSNRDLVGYTYPFLDGSALYVLPDDWAGQTQSVAATVRDFAGRRPQVWLVLDYSRGEDARHGFLEATLDTLGAKSTNRWFDTFRLVGYVLAPGQTTWKASGEDLGGIVRLDEYAVAPHGKDGDPLRVLFRWRALTPANTDYSLFVHVVSQQGDIVAQHDKRLARGGVGMKDWRPGEETIEAADILLPTGTPPGRYEVRAGLYRPDNGSRLPREGGGDYLSLGMVEVARAEDQRAPRLGGQAVALGDDLLALGFESLARPRPLEPLRLAVYLQPLARPTNDYRVVIGLLREGVAVDAKEAVPGGGGYPPRAWRKSEIVRELRQLIPPEAGRYRLGVRVLGEKPARTGAEWILLPGEISVDP